MAWQGTSAAGGTDVHHGRGVGELCLGPIFRGPCSVFTCGKLPHTCVKVRGGLGAVGSLSLVRVGLRVVCALQASQGCEC